MNLPAFLLESLTCRAPWQAQRSLQFYGARLSSILITSGGTVSAAGYCYPVEIDSRKLPSIASRKWSGTRKEPDEKRQKLERVAERIVQRHRERDGQEHEDDRSCSEPEVAQRYRKEIAEIKDFLDKNPK